MTTEQRRIWENEKRVVRRLRDGLNKPVDRSIVETVAILRLLGFYTSGSCGGHVDRRLSPYVRVKSPQGGQNRTWAYRAQRPSDQRHFRQLATKHNVAEANRLLDYVERFYASRAVPLRQRLVVHGFGTVGYDLMTQSRDLLHITPRDQRRAALQAERDELSAFTEFLKREFFEGDALPGCGSAAGESMELTYSPQ